MIDRWYPSSKTCGHCGHLLAILYPRTRHWVSRLPAPARPGYQCRTSSSRRTGREHHPYGRTSAICGETEANLRRLESPAFRHAEKSTESSRNPTGRGGDDRQWRCRRRVRRSGISCPEAYRLVTREIVRPVRNLLFICPCRSGRSAPGQCWCPSSGCPVSAVDLRASDLGPLWAAVTADAVQKSRAASWCVSRRVDQPLLVFVRRGRREKDPRFVVQQRRGGGNLLRIVTVLGDGPPGPCWWQLARVLVRVCGPSPAAGRPPPKP